MLRKMAVFLTLILVFGSVPYLAPESKAESALGLSPLNVLAAKYTSGSALQSVNVSKVESLTTEGVYFNFDNFDEIMAASPDVEWEAIISNGSETIFPQLLKSVYGNRHILAGLDKNMTFGVTYTLDVIIITEDGQRVNSTPISFVAAGATAASPEISGVSAKNNKTVVLKLVNADSFRKEYLTSDSIYSATVTGGGKTLKSVGYSNASSLTGVSNDDKVYAFELDGTLTAGTSYSLKLTVLGKSATASFTYGSVTQSPSDSGSSSSSSPSSSSPSSSSPSSSSSSPSTSATAPSASEASEPETEVSVSVEPGEAAAAEVTVSVAESKSGLMNLTIKNDVIASTVKQMQAEIRKMAKDERPENFNVALVIDTPANAKSVNAKLEKDALAALIKADAGISIDSKLVGCEIDSAALNALASKTKDTLSLSVKPVKSLNKAAKEIIGDRPVFDFSLKDGSKVIREVEEGTITYAIPYVPADDEDAENLIIVQIIKGKAQTVEAEYKDGKLVFSGDIDGVYGVGYIE